MFRRALAASILSCLGTVVACSGSGASGSSGSGAGGSGAGGLQIEPVTSVHETYIDGAVPPADGDLFVVVDLRLDNGTANSLSLAAMHFSIQTTGGVEITGDPATEDVMNGCRSNSSLAAGAKTECTVVFSVPADAETKLIVYTSDSGVRAEAPLKTAPCGMCNDECKDFSSDPENCGACNVSVGAGTCENGVPTCGGNATMCGADCVDLSTSPDHCGACNTPVPTGSTCMGGMPVCESGRTSCGGVCKDLSSDSNNCGACNKTCPQPSAKDFDCYGGEPPFDGTPNYGCYLSACTTAFFSTKRVSCDSICAMHSLTCKRADWAYSSSGTCLASTCSGTPPAATPDQYQWPFYGINCLCEG